MAIRYSNYKPVSRRSPGLGARKKGQKGVGRTLSEEELGALKKKLPVVAKQKPVAAPRKLAVGPPEVITKADVEAGRVPDSGITREVPLARMRLALQLQERGLPQEQASRVSSRAITIDQPKQLLSTQFAGDVSPLAKGLIGKLSEVEQKTFTFPSGEKVTRFVTTDPLSMREASLRGKDVEYAALPEKIKQGKTQGIVFEVTAAERAKRIFKESFEEKIKPKLPTIPSAKAGVKFFEDIGKPVIPTEQIKNIGESISLNINKLKVFATEKATKAIDFTKARFDLAKQQGLIGVPKQERETSPRITRALGGAAVPISQARIKTRAEIQQGIIELKELPARLKRDEARFISSKIPLTEESIAKIGSDVEKVTTKFIDVGGVLGKKIRGKPTKQFKGIIQFGEPLPGEPIGKFIAGGVEKVFTDIKFKPLKTAALLGTGIALSSLGVGGKVGKKVKKGLTAGKVVGKTITGGAGTLYVGGKAVQVALTPGARGKGAAIASEFPFLVGLALPGLTRGALRGTVKAIQGIGTGAKSLAPKLKAFIPKEIKLISTVKQTQFISTNVNKLLGGVRRAKLASRFQFARIGDVLGKPFRPLAIKGEFFREFAAPRLKAQFKDVLGGVAKPARVFGRRVGTGVTKGLGELGTRLNIARISSKITLARRVKIPYYGIRRDVTRGLHRFGTRVSLKVGGALAPARRLGRGIERGAFGLKTKAIELKAAARNKLIIAKIKARSNIQIFQRLNIDPKIKRLKFRAGRFKTEAQLKIGEKLIPFRKIGRSAERGFGRLVDFKGKIRSELIIKKIKIRSNISLFKAFKVTPITRALKMKVREFGTDVTIPFRVARAGVRRELLSFKKATSFIKPGQLLKEGTVDLGRLLGEKVRRKVVIKGGFKLFQLQQRSKAAISIFGRKTQLDVLRPFSILKGGSKDLAALLKGKFKVAPRKPFEERLFYKKGIFKIVTRFDKPPTTAFENVQTEISRRLGKTGLSVRVKDAAKALKIGAAKGSPSQIVVGGGFNGQQLQQVLLGEQVIAPDVIITPAGGVRGGRGLLGGRGLGAGLFLGDFSIKGQEKVRKGFQDLFRRVKSPQIPGMIRIPTTTIRSGQTQAQQQIIQPIVIPVPKPIPIPPPPRPPSILAFPDIFPRVQGRKPKKAKRLTRLIRFQPSLVGLDIGKRAPTPKFLTGLEVRFPKVKIGM